MMRKTAAILLIFFLFLAENAIAGAVEPTAPPWEILLEDGYPAVIDRVTDPEAWPDFAFSDDTEILHIWVANTRDTDAILLRLGDENWMIDCTEARWAPRVTAMFQMLDVTHIDRVINSHPHHDHLNGLAVIDDFAKVDELAICFPEDVNDHMINAVDLCGKRGITVTHYGDGSRFILGEAVLDVFMKSDESFSMNDQSAVIRLEYGDRTMLFTADMESAGQKRLLESVDTDQLRADVLKYPHHGKLKLKDEFYDAVNPSFVVVTNTHFEGNSYEYLSCLGVPAAYSAPAYVHLMTDGKHWMAEQVSVPVNEGATVQK